MWFCFDFVDLKWTHTHTCKRQQFTIETVNCMANDWIRYDTFALVIPIQISAPHGQSSQCFIIATDTIVFGEALHALVDAEAAPTQRRSVTNTFVIYRNGRSYARNHYFHPNFVRTQTLSCEFIVDWFKSVRTFGQQGNLILVVTRTNSYFYTITVDRSLLFTAEKNHRADLKFKLRFETLQSAPYSLGG